MGEIINRRRGLAAAVSLSAIAGLLTACAEGPAVPAPVYMRGAAPMAANGPPPPWHENKIVIVRRGQSLGEIARANHVPEGALIAANNLKPPYALHAGARLVIPDRDAPPTQQAMTPPRVAPPPMAAVSSVPIPPPQTAAVATPPPPASTAGARLPPDVVPLDQQPPPVSASGAPPAPGRNAAAAQPAPGGPVPPPAAEPASGRFPWPVRGRILANYGAATSGARNEGINIGAPLGTPVRSVDSGTVAYVGNEVKGYGNLVLVKHTNGWISAYAHLGDVTVKKGDTVSAGEVVAKVGDTGGVGVPQLHFELRRGQKPVDPKEFLEPAGSAAARVEQKAG